MLTFLGFSVTEAVAKKCPDPPCGGGGGGNVIETLDGHFTAHTGAGPGFIPKDPLLTTGLFSMASNDEFVVILEEPMDYIKLGGLLVRVKGGKAAGFLVFLSENDFAQGGSPVYETGMLPIDPAVPVSAEGFRLHVHADDVPLLRSKNKPPIGWISIGDLVFTPTP